MCTNQSIVLTFTFLLDDGSLSAGTAPIHSSRMVGSNSEGASKNAMGRPSISEPAVLGQFLIAQEVLKRRIQIKSGIGQQQGG
uniref:Uncharacterized protein n=1 Tax=Parascaris equorum TaxID=6256 RepID=A0A914R1B5_PAREQ